MMSIKYAAFIIAVCCILGSVKTTERINKLENRIKILESASHIYLSDLGVFIAMKRQQKNTMKKH